MCSAALRAFRIFVYFSFPLVSTHWQIVAALLPGCIPRILLLSDCSLSALPLFRQRNNSPGVCRLIIHRYAFLRKDKKDILKGKCMSKRMAKELHSFLFSTPRLFYCTWLGVPHDLKSGFCKGLRTISLSCHPVLTDLNLREANGHTHTSFF